MSGVNEFQGEQTQPYLTTTTTTTKKTYCLSAEENGIFCFSMLLLVHLKHDFSQDH